MAFGGEELSEDEAEFALKALLAKEAGWTLDYIDTLPPLKLVYIAEIFGASNAAVAHVAKRKR